MKKPPMLAVFLALTSMLAWGNNTYKFDVEINPDTGVIAGTCTINYTATGGEQTARLVIEQAGYERHPELFSETTSYFDRRATAYISNLHLNKTRIDISDHHDEASGRYMCLFSVSESKLQTISFDFHRKLPSWYHTGLYDGYYTDSLLLSTEGFLPALVSTAESAADNGTLIQAVYTGIIRLKDSWSVYMPGDYCSKLKDGCYSVNTLRPVNGIPLAGVKNSRHNRHEEPTAGIRAILPSDCGASFLAVTIEHLQKMLPRPLAPATNETILIVPGKNRRITKARNGTIIVPGRAFLPSRASGRLHITAYREMDVLAYSLLRGIIEISLDTSELFEAVPGKWFKRGLPGFLAMNIVREYQHPADKKVGGPAIAEWALSSLLNSWPGWLNKNHITSRSNPGPPGANPLLADGGFDLYKEQACAEVFLVTLLFRISGEYSITSLCGALLFGGSDSSLSEEGKKLLTTLVVNSTTIQQFALTGTGLDYNIKPARPPGRNEQGPTSFQLIQNSGPGLFVPCLVHVYTPGGIQEFMVTDEDPVELPRSSGITAIVADPYFDLPDYRRYNNIFPHKLHMHNDPFARLKAADSLYFRVGPEIDLDEFYSFGGPGFYLVNDALGDLALFPYIKAKNDLSYVSAGGGVSGRFFTGNASYVFGGIYASAPAVLDKVFAGYTLFLMPFTSAAHGPEPPNFGFAAEAGLRDAESGAIERASGYIDTALDFYSGDCFPYYHNIGIESRWNVSGQGLETLCATTAATAFPLPFNLFWGVEGKAQWAFGDLYYFGLGNSVFSHDSTISGIRHFKLGSSLFLGSKHKFLDHSHLPAVLHYNPLYYAGLRFKYVTAFDTPADILPNLRGAVALEFNYTSRDIPMDGDTLVDSVVLGISWDIHAIAAGGPQNENLFPKVYLSFTATPFF